MSKKKPAEKQTRRNVKVEEAVKKALERVDYFISGGTLDLPQSAYRRACEELIEKQSASVRTACLFLMFYWSIELTWDRNSVPIGARGKYGDKKLCEELKNRHITLGEIDAYFENLGTKGNVRSKNVRLLEDDRFKSFLTAVARAATQRGEIDRIADFLAQRYAESKREPTPMPPVGPDVLTFVRAKILFHKLMAIPSEGHIQQFLIAALLHEYRRRHSVEVTTHHPHAADKYDDTAGDIEEWREGKLLRAYEVTVRDDWKNRLSRFRKKMDDFRLSKYIIIAAKINTDDEWKLPATMALKLEPYGRDIAVVDIFDVVHFLAAELTPRELLASVNQAFVFLSDRKLSGRTDFKEAYKEAVRGWLDETSEAAHSRSPDAASEEPPAAGSPPQQGTSPT
jgi:hypothetical protein